jgi:hypothetical protein
MHRAGLLCGSRRPAQDVERIQRKRLGERRWQRCGNVGHCKWIEQRLQQREQWFFQQWQR